MEGLAYLFLFGLAIFFLIALPGIVFSLLGRVNRLEEQLNELLCAKSQEKRPLNQEPDAKVAAVVEKVAEEKEGMEEKKGAPVSQTREDPAETPNKVTPPALPTEFAEVAEVTEAADEEVFARKPNAPQLEPTGPSEVEVWLEKMGLKPPRPDDEDANPMAWWSTRIGLAFGVIAAVFLGMYVNQNTVPWVRLLELVLVAVAVFAGGCWFERKLQGFGRALSAGGLALLFVSAYAAYGLPAMKVIESPLMGTLAQVLALVLTVAWALWKGREAIFGLALVLGYVTCSFSASEGLEPVPLIALVVLSITGTALFAWRNWWSGLWGSVIGSGLGLAVLAIFTWGASQGPSLWVAQAVMLGLAALPLTALSFRWLQGESRVKRIVPVVTSIALFSGAIATGIRGFDFEVFYASFAALFFLAGWWWKRDEGEGLWQTLWAKAMVLLALFVIARFDGPVRGFALLGQGGVLLCLARTRKRVVFEVGAGLAALVGWYLLWEDSSAAGQWWGDRGILLLYLGVAQALIVLYRYLLGEDSIRRVAGVFFAVLVALEVLNVSLGNEENLWLILVPLAFGVLSLVQCWPLRLKDAEWTSFVLLAGSLIIICSASFQGGAVAGQAALWLLPSGVFYACLGRSFKPRHLGATMLMLVGFLVALWLILEETLGMRWMPPLFATLALGWHVLGSRFGYFSLRGFAVVAGVLAPFIFWNYGWRDGFDLAILLTLLAVLAWWFWGWKNPEEEELNEAVAEGARTAIGGAVLWVMLDSISAGLLFAVLLLFVSTLAFLAWRFLRAESLAWLGLVFSLLAGLVHSGETGHSLYSWSVALFFVIYAAHGVWLTRGESKSPLANPKVASLLWGAASMGVVLAGLAIVPTMASWTTASWAVAAVALLVTGFWFGLRGYRMLALGGLGATILRLFSVDIQDSFWRIVAFGVTGALLVGIGYLYNRFHKRLADGDLDWGAKS